MLEHQGKRVKEVLLVDKATLACLERKGTEGQGVLWALLVLLVIKDHLEQKDHKV